MARFKYKGPKDRPGMVLQYGDTIMFRLRLKDGSVVELSPGPSGKFPPGQDIGHDITDERVIRHMEADDRFERIS